ncbi:hypothetical protein Tco_0929540, partial [Tanacetum coccineum]
VKVVVAVVAWRWGCWSWGRGGSGVAVEMIGGVGWGGGDDNDGGMQLGWWRRVFRWRRWLLVVSVVMAAVVWRGVMGCRGDEGGDVAGVAVEWGGSGCDDDDDGSGGGGGWCGGAWQRVE